MNEELADCSELKDSLKQLGQALDNFHQFRHRDAMENKTAWIKALDHELPEKGLGINQVLQEIKAHLIPNGSCLVRPGSTSFITTAASNIGNLSSLISNVVCPQRSGLTAFNFLEELSLNWLADMFQLGGMKGVYSSGGSAANIVALGAARQWAFEQQGIDVAAEGINQPCRVYASAASHHTIQRACAVLGCGRNAVKIVASDHCGRMLPQALLTQIREDKSARGINMAVVANAGTTSTGAIDPILELGKIAREHNIWLHVDGAYGLPGILDPNCQHEYAGIELADSLIVDPHKWLGAPVGIGATFVRDRDILLRTFTQGESDYLEGSLSETTVQHSLDALGTPYFDYGLELSAPSRGAVVWAIIREIGVEGIRARVCRHNAMARQVAERARSHAHLELLQEPSLSICCFRFFQEGRKDLNELNREIHRQMVRNNENIPSTAIINGQLAIRPCFLGARTSWEYADAMVDEVIARGQKLITSCSQ